jgi:hypothetical protein
VRGSRLSDPVVSNVLIMFCVLSFYSSGCRR